MDREELRNTMTRMNEHPEDIARWCSRDILWNGERITVREPAPLPHHPELVPAVEGRGWPVTKDEE